MRTQVGVDTVNSSFETIARFEKFRSKTLLLLNAIPAKRPYAHFDQHGRKGDRAKRSGKRLVRCGDVHAGLPQACIAVEKLNLSGFQ